jgi:hypothetical protein
LTVLSGLQGASPTPEKNEDEDEDDNNLVVENELIPRQELQGQEHEPAMLI